MAGENKNEANRHYTYREEQKQFNCSLREYINELEATIVYKDEQTAQLQNRVAALLKQISVLTEEIRVKRENETSLMTSQIDRQEGDFELVFVSQDSSPAADEEFQNETGQSTTENSTDQLQYQRLEQENISLKEEVDKLRNENDMMRVLGTIIANPSCLQVKRQDPPSQMEEKLVSNLTEEANVSSDSHDSLSHVAVLEEQVDRSQLLEASTTNQDFESLDVQNGWNFNDSWAEDQVALSTVATANTVTKEIPFRGPSVEEERTKGNQEMSQDFAYQDADEMETS